MSRQPNTALADWAQAAIVSVLVADYLAAKAHFFLRFGEIPVSDYLAEHWPFWAAALALAALGNLIERVRARSEAEGSPTTG